MGARAATLRPLLGCRGAGQQGSGGCSSRVPSRGPRLPPLLAPRRRRARRSLAAPAGCQTSQRCRPGWVRGGASRRAAPGHLLCLALCAASHLAASQLRPMLPLPASPSPSARLQRPPGRRASTARGRSSWAGRCRARRQAGRARLLGAPAAAVFCPCPCPPPAAGPSPSPPAAEVDWHHRVRRPAALLWRASTHCGFRGVGGRRRRRRPAGSRGGSSSSSRRQPRRQRRQRRPRRRRRGRQGAHGGRACRRGVRRLRAVPHRG